MSKVFNTTAVCVPSEHYMVNIDRRLEEIKSMVDAGKYFTINRARQFGKTTTLVAMNGYLKDDYYIVMIDFQTFGSEDFKTEIFFSTAFAESFKESLEFGNNLSENLEKALSNLEDASKKERFTLRLLFKELKNICKAAERPIVLMIDEVDSASNNQVFIDFLGQLRAQYIARFQQPAFQSVILAGVYDVKNLRQKIRPEDDHKYNSPWNIAADFNIDMSFSAEEISQMLYEYEEDHHTGMDVNEIASLIYDHTSGYPFLVSRLCQIMDENLSEKEDFKSKKEVWSSNGCNEAVKLLLSENNTLFESLMRKLNDYPELNDILKTILFTGQDIAYNSYNNILNMAAMFGFIKNKNGNIAVYNRIFETMLYNYYLSASAMQSEKIYSEALTDKNQFIVGGHLNMRLILEKFTVHFNDLYGDREETFIEDEGRKYFLLYLRPIINGIGNYYIEAETRHQRRTDIIVDYNGEQYIIEMKIWRGQEYNRRGEEQLSDYLDYYHINKGYMLSFNFNKEKKIGVYDVAIGDKVIVEAVV